MTLERRLLLHSKGKEYPVETIIQDDLKPYIWRAASVYLHRDEYGWVLEQKLALFGLVINKDMHCLPAGTILHIESKLPVLAVNQSPHYLVETHHGHSVDVGDSQSSSLGLYSIDRGVNTTIVEEGIAEIFYITIFPTFIDRLCKVYPEMKRFKRWMDITKTHKVHTREIQMNYIRETAKRRMLACQDLRMFRARYIHRCAITFLCNFMNELVEGSGAEISQLEKDYAQEIAEVINTNLYVFDMERFLATRFNKNFQDLNDHFQAVMHCSIPDYVKMERMEWAFLQLTTTNQDEQTIASLSGYLPRISADGTVRTNADSFDEFKKDFKGYFRCTIMEVRVQHN
ncbi:hypothetical protein [Chitinophaga sp. sic0106]|uniref:hypothetical protein n=1 Tax=Chitinophaga sp. sic0106 TaxID=2854785 RepID=UPI001C44AB25|nr:hypothetical protein [Chitinophaga sp. sic0106]MBV7532059.1 hypothetical protein [Chitinophaga sp. sic0106]